MRYRYRAVEPFWTRFYRLNAPQKESVRKAWEVFKVDPFDPRLRTHKIEKLSAHYKRTIYAVEIESNLRVIFYIEADVVVSVDIGDHRIYRR